MYIRLTYCGLPASAGGSASMAQVDFFSHFLSRCHLREVKPKKKYIIYSVSLIFSTTKTTRSYGFHCSPNQMYKLIYVFEVEINNLPDRIYTIPIPCLFLSYIFQKPPLQNLCPESAKSHAQIHKPFMCLYLVV